MFECHRRRSGFFGRSQDPSARKITAPGASVGTVIVGGRGGGGRYGYLVGFRFAPPRPKKLPNDLERERSHVQRLWVLQRPETAEPDVSRLPARRPRQPFAGQWP